MKTTRMAGTQVWWLVIPRGGIDASYTHAYRSRRAAVHFIEHRVEGWDGWRLLAASAFAKVSP